MTTATRRIHNYVLFSFCVFTITITPKYVEGEIEILLDTRTALSDLGWTMSAGSEWQEMTSGDASGNERRMLMVCEIRKANQDNWMRSEYINVRGAQRVYVEVEFTIRSCEDVPNVATCKETFNLYYYETDRDEATSTFPPWNEEAYTKVDTIAADQRFQPGSSNTNFETRDIGPLTKSGIYLAVQDTGACVAIMHVRVYYKYCVGNTTNLAAFSKTVTGPEVTSLVETKGSCVRNAVTPNGMKPSLYCNGEGKWTVPSGTCACSAGYEPNKQRTQCTICQPGLYKSTVANHRCRRCPDYSNSNVVGATICECMIGYFRSQTETAYQQCTKPPSKPVKLYINVNQTTVVFSWNIPLNAGGREDLSYEIHCMRCQSGFTICQTCSELVQYSPSSKNIKSTQVIISSLYSYAFYKFKVCAVNGVTDVAKSHGNPLNNCAESAIETNQAAPSAVDRVRTSEVADSFFVLEWELPLKPNGKILNYQVFVSHVGNDASSEKSTNPVPYRLNSTTQPKMTIRNLIGGEVYMVKVRARTIAGYGPYSVPIRVETSAVSASPEIVTNDGISVKQRMEVIHLVLIGAGSLIAILLLVALVCFCRRRRVQKLVKKKCDPEKPGAVYNGGNVHFVQNVITKGHKTYVDPTTYEDPNRAVREFTKEIDVSFVKIEEVIGGGEFGEVCKGKLQLPKFEQSVAIKTLKSGYSTQQKLDFLGEASIMGQFDHSNVIRLEGVVTKSRPLMIITEYMENGSLDTYLRRHDNQLSAINLVGMLHNIGSGMKYLSEMGYVHRDLAARNILVDSQLICKVSDFGMSRVLEEDDGAAYTTRGGKIPIRWTAPEAINFRKFTSSSDVWSFGIVMWEVMSYGERPYWGMSNQDVMNAIDNGYRLPAPMDCPQVSHKLMLDCWKKDRNQRPKFNEIVTSLDNMLKEPDQLKVKVNTRRNMNVPPSNIIPGRPSTVLPSNFGKSSIIDTKPSLTPVVNGQASNFVVRNDHSSSFMNDHDSETAPMLISRDDNETLNDQPNNNPLGAWLESLELYHYMEIFIQHGRNTVQKVAQMKRSDLINIGILDQSHQDVLLKSIHDISQTDEEREIALPSYAESNLTYSGISV